LINFTPIATINYINFLIVDEAEGAAYFALRGGANTKSYYGKVNTTDFSVIWM